MLSQRKEPYETFQTPDLQPSFTAKLSLIDTWVRQRLTTIAHSFIRDAFASFREEPPNNAHPAGPAGWDAEYHLRVQPQSASSDVDGPFSIYRKIGHGALNLTRITNTSAESPHYGLFRFRYTATFINPHPAKDGEVFSTNATVRDIEGSGCLEAFLRKEIGIEEAAALAYLSDGRRLRTDNTIFMFNKYYLDRDPDEVAGLLHLKPPLQPSIDESQTTTLPELSTAFHLAVQRHLRSISRIVESMRHQRSTLQLASRVAEFHVLNVSDVVSDVRQELDKCAALADSVDGAMYLASRVQIHREFMSLAVLRAMDAGGTPRMLGHSSPISIGNRDVVMMGL
ncbi:hypothetical protein EI94DRAFT_1832475 [Lactarius quietus]|nr:hypothetical protein EI94DRAFT_1832475 [Lactarius quietus]